MTARARFFTKRALQEWESRYPPIPGQPTGLCFPYANLALKRFGDDATVVHARVLHGRRGNRNRIHHAWIEHQGRVYDYQNAELRNTSIPVDTFYKISRPRNVQRYSPEEALIMSCRIGKHGPWE